MLLMSPFGSLGSQLGLRRQLLLWRSLMFRRCVPSSCHSNPLTPNFPPFLQIYFASRTHSQLSQLIEELRKTPFSESTPQASTSALPTPTSSSSSSQRTHPLRVIPLGARQQLCINDEIRSKAGGNSEALNDLCLDLQKATGKEKRCTFLPPLSEPGKINEFRDQALVSPPPVFLRTAS